MAQFVTHIQPTLVEASQGHMPHHHGHQVGLQHQSHLPHSGHNMPSPPTHNHYHNQNIQQQQQNSQFYGKNQNGQHTKFSNEIFTSHSGGDGNTSFLRAARAGNLEKVLEHLKNNIDINTSNNNGLNALHLASKDGHIHVVSELLKRGATVDSATKKGNTALHIASLAGQEEVVSLLLQSSASVNVQSQNGFTPLYMAAQENHDKVVKLLLANGANQSLATEDGFTPLAVAMQQGHDKVVAVLLESDTRGKVRLPALHIAAKKDDVKAASLLLENDHNPDITSKSGFTPLHIASHYGNQSIANLLIQKGADVNYLAKHNISPLHVAAKWGKTNMVSLLLEKGANIEAKTRDGLTPLHCAARSGHEQVVDMLLERGAPISAKTKNGLAPLHMAAQGEHVDAARILLYHRAPVDEVTVDYLTALHVAAHCGHVRVAKLLLDRSADANARALNGFTPLHIACKKNRIKVVELLLRHGASISATTESGLTPLHVAAFMGCMNIVIYLLQHDASPDVPTVRGETPLHLAARANQTDIIRILLRNGAQVDARAREQQTPLHIASRLGNVDIVMLLLQHGAQVDATTKDMYTALHIAAKEGQDEVCAVLIENGAALDSATKKGFTPLHLAAKYGHMKVAQLLLQKDAPVDAQGKNGVTPLHVACHYDKQNVALLLLERGASPHAPAKNGHTPLHIAARKNQMDIASTLLEYEAHADTESKAGFTPLHLSSQEGHSDLSSLLIEHKANCNHAAKNGLTPMHLCAQEDNVNVAEILMKNGADINMVTKAGYTPLHVASHFGQSNMVRFLLQNSAKVDAATSIGYTSLHQAAQQGHCHIVNLLLEHKANANAQTVNGQTPLHIAKKLGYISVLDSLKSITLENDIELKEQSEDKYRVVAPEAMHEIFMSDSEEEGGEDNALSDQPYRYLTVDEMKSLGDDSLPIDVTRDERVDSNRIVQANENIPIPFAIEPISPHQTEMCVLSKNTFDGANLKFQDCQEVIQPRRKLQWKNFLVSFLVDARGGAMRGCRHSGVKMIIPSRSTCQPTRITCRYVKPQRTMHPPQLMEGEALASRVLELGPVSLKFQGPILMEVPHFASLRCKEREIIILRSDNGETWREHSIDNSEEIIFDVLNECFESEEINQLNDQTTGHVCRFVTYDFPQYFAVVSRVRQEVHAIGSEGGMVSSTVVPQVQAVFPQGALTKKIKVGLQAQPVDPDLTAKLLGRGVAVSPIVTVEPRRRKFHKAITLNMPAPKAHSQGMINQYSGNTPTLRLLCSITGGASRAQWEDVTGSTPLTFVNECVSFTTTVSARFWLMDCRNISEATKMATELYREVIHVPFMAKFVVFAKRVEYNEAKLRVFCTTDDREDKTLEKQEHFIQVAKSRDVEVLEGKPQYIEMAGNLVPVTKSGDQLHLLFKAFRENRLPFTIRIKDQHADIVGRALFMKEPKIAKGEPPQHPICILNIILPEIVILDPQMEPQEKNKSDYLPIDSNGSSYVGNLRIVDLSNLLGNDYVKLGLKMGITQSDIDVIVAKHPSSIARQAQELIHLLKQYEHFNVYVLEQALKEIGRDDILKTCKIAQNNRMDSSLQCSPTMDYKQSSPTQGNNDREEIKYSAEEKEFEESESDDDNEKRTVAERREKIVKRLSIERQIPASSQQKEIVQEITEIKRRSLIEDKKAIHEEEIMLHMPMDNVVKTNMAEHVRVKFNKMETELSKSSFHKESVLRLKTSTKNDDDDNDAKYKQISENDCNKKENKLTTNENIRKLNLSKNNDNFKQDEMYKTTSDSGICDGAPTNREEGTCFNSVVQLKGTNNSIGGFIFKSSVDEKEQFCESIEQKNTRKKNENGTNIRNETEGLAFTSALFNKSDSREMNSSIQVSAALEDIIAKEEFRADTNIKETTEKLSNTPPCDDIIAKEEFRADTNIKETTEKLSNTPPCDDIIAKEEFRADTNIKETTEKLSNTPPCDALSMHAIKEEASFLVHKVLEESLTILNIQQQKSIETEFNVNLDVINQSDKLPIATLKTTFEQQSDECLNETRQICLNNAEILRASPTMVHNVNDKKIEKQIQKLSSEIENIDKNVEYFNGTFSTIVHEDELSSLQQDFSKISWIESISATASTIADTEQITSDNDIQDFSAETGEEITQHDLSDELPTKDESLAQEVTPIPTPRTLYRDIKEETDKILIEKVNDGQPIPKPRQQQSENISYDFIQPVTKLSGQTSTDLNEYDDTFSKKEQIAQKLITTPIRDKLHCEPEININQSSESLNTVQVIYQEYEDTNEMKSKKVADEKEKQKTIDDELEKHTSFYIGELSSNVIIKSKPSFKEEGKDYESNTVQEHENIIEKGIIIEPEQDCSQPEELEVHSFQDNKVMRQSSETRNDLLEIETYTQKSSKDLVISGSPISPSACDVFVQLSEIKHQPLFETNQVCRNNTEKNDHDNHKSVEKNVPKIAKLDLLLDKSELELSEKCSTNTLSMEITDNAPDEGVLLVEKTLEEVQQSLDAAKEELIQVVRDGKSIKQSPSEFEFRNISHLKSGTILQEVEKYENAKGLTSTILDNIPEISGQPDDILDCSMNVALDSVQHYTQFDRPPSQRSISPKLQRWSLHEGENSSSSESNYKSSSRPYSSDFEVHTIYTSSEYQTALDASICKESTEYVSAISSLDNSGKTISSHESMKSLSSDISGNLASIDTSDFSETLVASIEEHDEDIDIEGRSMDLLQEDINTVFMEDLGTMSSDHENQQNSMKRSQEMIFTTEGIPENVLSKQIDDVPEISQSIESKMLASSLEENSFLSSSTISCIDTVIQNVDDLIGSAGSSSLIGIELCSTNEDNVSFQVFETQDINEGPQEIHTEENAQQNEQPRKGHKRMESTSLNNEVVKKKFDGFENPSDEIEVSSLVLNKTISEDPKGSESESDHDPYESEYSRAFKSPTQRKKRKEKKHTETLDKSNDPAFSSLHLAAQTIIEDTVTEEIESQIAAEELRLPSQNMQDYSNIPNITVTEDIIKLETESDAFCDSTLYKVKTQDELHKVEDVPIQKTSDVAFSIIDEQFNELMHQQYKQKLADLENEADSEFKVPDSPDSFEMIDQPDITDEFVIIEEVAKEANELDTEGKSIKIRTGKITELHDEEVEQILIKSAPAATNLGSQIFKDDLNFDFEESPPSARNQTDTESVELLTNKKWVETQLSDTSQLRYPYELDRGILEDIKEEESEFEIGSSRISSFKDSYSSTPDYDVLAGRKYFTKNEHDDISMNSLQEFENLEQAISLENRKGPQGSTESSSGSFTRRIIVRNTCGDDISLSSLKEFEGLESACIEAHLIEIKAEEEAALLLSRSDESNKSNKSTNGNEYSHISVNTTSNIPQSITTNSIEIILKSKLRKCEEPKLSLMELSTDSLEIEANAIDSKNDDLNMFKHSIDRTVHSQMLGIDSTALEESAHLPLTIVCPSVTTDTQMTQMSDNISKDFSNDSLNSCIDTTSTIAANATQNNENISIMSDHDSIISYGSSTLIEDSSILHISHQSLTQNNTETQNEES